MENGARYKGRGDGIETGRVKKEKKIKNRRPVSMHVSPRTLGIKRRATS